MGARTLVVAGLFIIGAVAVSGQPQRNQATLDDLVVEIRGLRADLRQTAGAGMRMQLLTARLSLQEQRIAVLAGQHADVVTRLAAATRQRSEAEAQLQKWETVDTRNLPPEFPRNEVEGRTEIFKSALSRQRDAERQLRAQEAELAAQTAAEQGRWADFSGRLDDLERSLPVAAPR